MPHCHAAFRLKMRTDAIESHSLTDPFLYEEKAKLARDMAQILRMNVVQGEKVWNPGEEIPVKWRKFLSFFVVRTYEKEQDFE